MTHPRIQPFAAAVAVLAVLAVPANGQVTRFGGAPAPSQAEQVSVRGSRVTGGPGAKSPPPPATRARMTPWGHPDLQGRWTNATLTPLERPLGLSEKEFFTPDEAAEYARTALQTYIAQINQTDEAGLAGEFGPELWGEQRGLVATRRTSLIVGPTGRVPPLTPEARARAARRAASNPPGKADGPEDRPLNERCLWFSTAGPPMLPSITYNSNYEIVQTPDAVVIHVEMGDAVRIIPLDGRPHLPIGVTQWLGDSRGHWEGETLVVDTTNVSAKRELRGSSNGLHVIERFTRTADDTLLYRFTASDPGTWTEPWTAEIPMTTLSGLLYEYACHEGNRSLENILRAARTADQRDASSSRPDPR